MKQNLMGALAASTCIVGWVAPAQAQERSFEIPAGNLRPALDAFGRQSGKPIIYKVDDIRGLRTKGYRGTAEPRAALNVILSGTGFTAHVTGSGAVAIVATPAAQETPATVTSVEPESQEVDGKNDIIVTATKRNVAIQDVPAAIDVVSGESIAKTQSFSLESFSRLNPSLQVNNRGVGDNQVIVRGISSAGKPTVGLYFDETIITGVGFDDGGDNQPNIQLHDIERVEILKGPQGTLFGASSLGGTVRIITNKPNLNESHMGLTLSGAAIKGGNGRFQAEAFADLPIVEGAVGARAVAWTDTGGGYIDRNGPFVESNVNDHHVNGGRITLLAKPTDDISLTFTATHQESEAEGAQYFKLDQGAYNTNSETAETFGDNIDIFSFVGNYRANFGTFTVTSSYFNRDLLLRRDSTPTARRFGIPGFLGFHQSQKFTNWSNEARFASDLGGPFDFVAGVFYSDQKSDSALGGVLADPATGRTPCDFIDQCRAAGLATRVITATYGKSKIRQFAAFSEGNLELFSGLTATVGLRYYKADISQLSVFTQRRRLPTSPVQTVDQVGLDVSTNEDQVSYNFALAYEVNRDTTFYARAASGFRPGGANNAARAAELGVSAPEHYSSDKLWNYELGAKSWLFDRKLYAELALFYINWSNQQIAATDPGGVYSYIDNAGRSRVKGAEFSLSGNPTDGLSIGVGVTYTDSRLAEDLPPRAQTPAFKGDRLPYTPRWSAAGQFTYEQPLADNFSGYIGANVTYRGSSYTAFNRRDSNFARLEDYVLINGRVGVREGPVDVAVFVDNITDQIPQIGLRVSGDGYQVYTTQPRTIGLRMSANF